MSKKWEDISPIAKNAVNDILSGSTPNPLTAGTVGWFGKGTWRSRENSGVNARAELKATHQVRNNVFYQRLADNGRTENWSPDKVKIIPGSTRVPV